MAKFADLSAWPGEPGEPVGFGRMYLLFLRCLDCI